MLAIKVQVLDRGEAVPGARVFVGETDRKTSIDGTVQCRVPVADIQLVRIEHDGREVKRWVLPETEQLTVDLAKRTSAESLLDNLVGDRYRFIEVLGRGGMGVVIKAHDSLLNRVVAIKMLAGELEDSIEAQRIFLEEARALAPLTHPNLVSIHDILHLEGHTLMVLEFVIGENLDRLLSIHGRFSPDTVLRYVIQMARAASFMHRKGFIHRDLKPGNVIVGENDSVKIIDFGLARSLEAISAKGTQIRGTPAYMAPEQVRGLDLTDKVDTYQLGVTLFELLTGELPFGGDMGYAHVHTTPPTLLDKLPTINPELSVLVAACLAKEPDDRPTSRELLDALQGQYVVTAEEISDAIQEVERLSGERISDWRRTTGGLSAVSEPVEAKSDDDRSLVVPVLLGLLLAVAIGIFFAIQSPRPPQPSDAATAPAPEATPEAAVAVGEPAEPAPAIAPDPLPPPDTLGTSGSDAGVADAGTKEPAKIAPPPKPAVKRPVASRPKPKPKPKPKPEPEPEPVKVAEKPDDNAPAIRTTRRSSPSKSTAKKKKDDDNGIRLSR